MTHPWVQARLRYQKWLFQRISKAPPQLQTLWKLNLILTSVACAVGPSVNPLQNTKTQHVNIVLQCTDQFFEQPNIKGNHSWIEWQAFKCYHNLSWFFLPKPDFLEFIWIFSGRNHLKINTSHIHNQKLTKSKTFALQVQMSWNQSPCTPSCWELSKDTKNTIWSIPVRWIS